MCCTIIKFYIRRMPLLGIGPIALTLRRTVLESKNKAAYLNTEILLLSINTRRICSAAESSIVAAFFDRLVQCFTGT